MLMIEPQRTGLVPLWFLVTCVGLFVLRAGLFVYSSCCVPTKTTQIQWQKPELVRESTDLLSRPVFYYFCDTRNPMGRLLTQIVDLTVFNNRDVRHCLESDFVPVKVERGSTDELVVAHLVAKMRVVDYPSMVFALPDGERVESTLPWQTDRMMLSTLLESRTTCYSWAGFEAMRNADFAVAGKAFCAYFNDAGSESQRDYRTRLFYWVALERQNKDTEARQMLESTLKRVHGWPQCCMKFLLGEVTEKQLIARSGEENETPLGYYILGEKLLLEGKKSDAKEAFKNASVKVVSGEWASVLAEDELKKHSCDPPGVKP